MLLLRFRAHDPGHVFESMSGVACPGLCPGSGRVRGVDCRPIFDSGQPRIERFLYVVLVPIAVDKWNLERRCGSRTFQAQYESVRIELM